MNKKQKDKLQRRRRQQLAKERELQSRRQSWGAVQLLVGSFAVVMVENLLRGQGKISGVLFFGLLAVICLFFGIRNLALLGLAKRAMTVGAKLLGIKKIRLEIEEKEPKQPTKEEEWADF